MSVEADWIRDEQANLWSDLGEAIGRAANGAWSMECSNFARRIIEAAHVVGPVPWQQVPTSLVAGGVYETLLRVGGFTPQVPDEAAHRDLEKLQERTTGGYFTRREDATREFAATRMSIKVDVDLLAA